MQYEKSKVGGGVPDLAQNSGVVVICPCNPVSSQPAHRRRRTRVNAFPSSLPNGEVESPFLREQSVNDEASRAATEPHSRKPHELSSHPSSTLVQPPGKRRTETAFKTLGMMSRPDREGYPGAKPTAPWSPTPGCLSPGTLFFVKQ